MNPLVPSLESVLADTAARMGIPAVIIVTGMTLCSLYGWLHAGRETGRVISSAGERLLTAYGAGRATFLRSALSLGATQFLFVFTSLLVGRLALAVWAEGSGQGITAIGQAASAAEIFRIVTSAPIPHTETLVGVITMASFVPLAKVLTGRSSRWLLITVLAVPYVGIVLFGASAAQLSVAGGLALLVNIGTEDSGVDEAAMRESLMFLAPSALVSALWLWSTHRLLTIARHGTTRPHSSPQAPDAPGHDPRRASAP